MNKTTCIHLILLIISTFLYKSVHAQTAMVTEFYNTNLKHYFLALDSAEIIAIDSGGAGPGWIRTGESMIVWKNAMTAPIGALAVCRFYNKGANSHFYTSNPNECQLLKTQNPTNELNDKSWYLEDNENNVFYVLPSLNNACGADQKKVTRHYNGRGLDKGINDANHRYTINEAESIKMATQGWITEGVVFCTNSGNATPPVASPSNINSCIPTLSVGDSVKYLYNSNKAGLTLSKNVTYIETIRPTTHFRGIEANYVVGVSGDMGPIREYYYSENAYQRTLLGYIEPDGVITYYLPPITQYKNMEVGKTQKTDHFVHTESKGFTSKYAYDLTLTLNSTSTTNSMLGSTSKYCSYTQVSNLYYSEHSVNSPQFSTIKVSYANSGGIEKMDYSSYTIETLGGSVFSGVTSNLTFVNALINGKTYP